MDGVKRPLDVIDFPRTPKREPKIAYKRRRKLPPQFVVPRQFIDKPA